MYQIIGVTSKLRNNKIKIKPVFKVITISAKTTNKEYFNNN